MTKFFYFAVIGILMYTSFLSHRDAELIKKFDQVQVQQQ